jgi:WD40 repeat protein/tRNA A-37 threonylcarbamoyl transferase component Bud32
VNEHPSDDLLDRWYASLSCDGSRESDLEFEAIEQHLNQPCPQCNAYIAHRQDELRDRELNPALLDLVQPAGPAPASSVEGGEPASHGMKRQGPIGPAFPSSCAASSGRPTPPAVSEVKAALAEQDRYEVLRLLGSGGMGAVYLATQKSMVGRRVALKVLRQDLTRHRSLFERFRREVNAAARVSPHPNIVVAYDAGLAGTIHFLAMEYVDGIDLGRLVEKCGPQPPAFACHYAMETAQGLEYLHRQGMVHRDIKPQNLMLTRDNHIKILDFGLARLALEVWTTVTRDDSLLGTADYLAPEQAREAHTVDVRADIYSLGCTLYFLLTGQPPFPGTTLAQKLLAHDQAAPRPVAAFRSDLPFGLERVIDRMMAKDPAQRYQSPAEVVLALAPFARPAAIGKASQPTEPASAEWELLAGSIQLDLSDGDKAGTAPRARRLRPPVQVIAPWLLGAVALAGFGVGVHHVRTDNGELIIETIDPSVEIVVQQDGNLVIIIDPKSKRRIELRSGLYQLKLNGKGAADLQLSTGDFIVKRGGKTIVRVRRAVPEPAAATAPAVGKIRRLEGHTGPVLSVVFSPDGHRCLSASGWPEGDRTARLWDLKTGREIRRFVGHEDGVGSVAFSPDGRRFLSGSNDKSMRLWDVETGRELRRFDGHTGILSSVAFTPDGRHALSASFDKSLRLWDVESGQELRRFNGHTDWVFGAALSPDGHHILSGSKDWTLRVWDIETGHELQQINGQSEVRCVAFAPGGQRVLSAGGGGSQDWKVRLWDAATGQELRQFDGHTSGIISVAFSPDGKRILSGGCDRTVRLWDVDTGQELQRFDGHKDFVQAVTFSPDGRSALSAGGVRDAPPGYAPGSDFAIRLWALPVAGEAPKALPEAAVLDRP